MTRALFAVDASNNARCLPLIYLRTLGRAPRKRRSIILSFTAMASSRIPKFCLCAAAENYPIMPSGHSSPVAWTSSTDNEWYFGVGAFLALMMARRKHHDRPPFSGQTIDSV